MDEATRSLTRRVIALLAPGFSAPPDDAALDPLAGDLLRYQCERGPAYGEFVAARGVDPSRVTGWRQVPPLPQAAWKELEIRCFPAREACLEFHTSGTTEGRPGRHWLATPELYDAALEQGWGWAVVPDGVNWPVRALLPSPRQAPRSSLSYMVDRAAHRFSDGDVRYYLNEEELDQDRLRRDLAALERPVVLAGTAFAFVAALDQGGLLSLPPGSRLLETGGYKGRTREVPRAELYRELKRALGVPASRIVNEYGMTELGSQLYDTLLPDRSAPAGDRAHVAPSWARVRVLDPLSLEDRRPGEEGLIAVYDPVNLGSAAAVLTEDLGVLRSDGRLQILGRAPRAEPRGCSLDAEELRPASGEERTE